MNRFIPALLIWAAITGYTGIGAVLFEGISGVALYPYLCGYFSPEIGLTISLCIAFVPGIIAGIIAYVFGVGEKEREV